MIVSQQRAHRGVARTAPRRAPAPQAASSSVVPYDYAATFELTGTPGNLVQAVVNISVEAVFVATAIGYGLEQDRGEKLAISLADGASLTFLPGDTTLGQIPTDALLTGFRVDPQFQSMVFKPNETLGGGSRLASVRPPQFSDVLLPVGFTNTIFQAVVPRQEISFFFSMVDSSSGRELQDEPTHNLASLGSSNGERPFRQLAQPLYFMPRSTLRLQIEERSEGVTGTLFIVLYGYKIHSVAGCPEPVARSIQGPPSCRTESIGSPTDRAIPFDYVTKFQLTGREGNLLEDEIGINIEGGFIATALGYGLAAEDQKVPVKVPKTTIAARGASRSSNTVTITTTAPHGFSVHDQVTIADVTDSSFDGIFVIVSIPSSTTFTYAQIGANATSGNGTATGNFDLSSVQLRDLPANALIDGFRVRPSLVRIAFQDNGELADSLPSDFAGNVLESLNRPEDISFRYSILDTGSGRELQNQPINNIAGLGIANGKRPFKKLARPMIFLPRSTVRVSVEERFGRGTLFIVLQGYKILGGAPTGGRR